MKKLVYTIMAVLLLDMMFHTAIYAQQGVVKYRNGRTVKTIKGLPISNSTRTGKKDKGQSTSSNRTTAAPVPVTGPGATPGITQRNIEGNGEHTPDSM